MRNMQRMPFILLLLALFAAAGFQIYRAKQPSGLDLPPLTIPQDQEHTPSEQATKPVESAPAPLPGPAAEAGAARDHYLTVPIGPDGNALPPPRHRDEMPAPAPIRFLRSTITASPAVFRPRAGQPAIILARGKAPNGGPVKLEPIGPGNHQLGEKGGGKHYGAGPGGGKSYDDGRNSEKLDPTGSWDMVDKDGNTHLEAPDDNGTIKGYFEDNNGNRRNFRIGDDGSTEIENGDGTVDRVDKDGNRSIDLDGNFLNDIGPGGKGDGSGGGGGKGAAGGVGEPHFLSFDGTSFSTQAVGEFVLAQGVAGQDLQLRLQPYKDSRAVSAIAGFAMRAGGAEIEVLLDGSIRIDGALVGPGAALRYDLPQGGALGLWREADALTHVVLIWPDLSTLWIDRYAGFLNFSVQWRRPEASRIGLLGRDDNDASNDLTLRDGGLASAADPVAVKAFVESWRVSDEDSLFSYRDSESTATFTDLSFPYAAPEPSHSDIATALCADLKFSFAREACLFDVAVTGDQDFATAAAAIDQQLATLGLPDTKAVAPAVAASVAGDCKTNTDDPKAAAALENESVDVTLTAPETRLYRFDTSGGISVLTRADISYSGEYAPGLPAYCIFDAAGATVIPLTHSGTDSSFSRADQSTLPAGTYYIKVSGTGQSALSLILNQPQ